MVDQLIDVIEPMHVGARGERGETGPRGPQGLPGVNAVPADNAVAGYVNASGSATFGALTAWIEARSQSRDVFDPRDFGAKVDGVLTTCTMQAKSNRAVFPASVILSSADVGKRIGVRGAGRIEPGTTGSQYGNDGVLIATITQVADSHTAVLSETALRDVNNVKTVYGTSDSAALQAAFDACQKHQGGTVLLPAGRMIVTQSIRVFGGLTVRGVNSYASHVYPVYEVPGNLDLSANAWMYVQGVTRSFWCLDFHLDAFAMGIARGGVATSSVKPLQIHNVVDGGIMHCMVENTPSTALPFDSGHGTNIIAYNRVVNPGRLAKPHGASPGCAGVGIGTPSMIADTDNMTYTAYVVGNTIEGGWSSQPNVFGDTYSASNYGIFLETQNFTPGNASISYVIFGNTIRSCRRGIGLGGGRHVRVIGNVIRNCGACIAIDTGSYAPGTPTAYAIIANNSLSSAMSTGDRLEQGDGILIEVRGDRGLVQDLYPRITGNTFEGNRYAIRIWHHKTDAGALRGIAIVGNTFISNNMNLYVHGLDSNDQYKDGYMISSIQFSDNMLGACMYNISIQRKVNRLLITGNIYSESGYVKPCETTSDDNKPQKIVIEGNDDNLGYQPLNGKASTGKDATMIDANSIGGGLVS